jgi:hypothetical protein
MKLYKIIIMSVMFLATTYSQTFYYSDFTGSAIDSLLHKVDSMLIANNYLTYKNFKTSDSTGTLSIEDGWLISVGDPSTTKYGRMQSYLGGIVQGEMNASVRGGLQFNVVRNTVTTDGWMELRFNDGTRKWYWGCDASYGYNVSTKSMKFIINAVVSTASAAQFILSSTLGAFTVPVQGTSFNFAPASIVAGTADAITINYATDIPALTAGLEVTFVAEGDNTGATTLAVDGGTVKNIYEQVGAAPNALDANDIRTGMVVRLIYDGTQWVMMSPSGN